MKEENSDTHGFGQTYQIHFHDSYSSRVHIVIPTEVLTFQFSYYNPQKRKPMIPLYDHLYLQEHLLAEQYNYCCDYIWNILRLQKSHLLNRELSPITLKRQDYSLCYF